MQVTSVGPVEPTTRDKLAAYRDARELPNYNEALKTLLRESEGKD